MVGGRQRLRIHLVAGIAERDRRSPLQRRVVAGPQGYIGTYRKLHLWGDEHLFFESGDIGLPVFHTEIGSLAAVICYDGWFPEVYRLLAMKGADVVCMPTNWVPMQGQSPERTAMANTLAMANGAQQRTEHRLCQPSWYRAHQLFIGQSLIVGAEAGLLAGPGQRRPRRDPLRANQPRESAPTPAT